MRDAETRSILARSAFDARSLSMPVAGDSASTFRSSPLSAGGGLDKDLDVDEELVRSGPYLSHYREMASKQRGAAGHKRQDAVRNRQTVLSVVSELAFSPSSTPRGSVSSPPAAPQNPTLRHPTTHPRGGPRTKVGYWWHSSVRRHETAMSDGPSTS